MSNPKNAINQIKNLMKQYGFFDEETVELQSFKLSDDTILRTESLETGKKIFKINDAFEQVSLEDGSYRINNFNVDVKDGEIVNVQEVFLDAKLSDGTQIKVEGDSLVEGAKVLVVTQEGSVPAPDGTHELEDGTKVETKDGIVTTIEEKVEEEEEGPKVEIEVGEDMGGMKELYSLLEDMMKKVSEKMKNMEQKMETMKDEFESFKKQPAGKRLSDGKTDFNQVITNSEDDKINAIMSLRNKNK